MTAAPRQLVLDLAHRQALGAEDFLVSRSNAAAVELIDRWPDWPHPACVVVGPEGAGKSHLANVWRLRSGASHVGARLLSDAAVAAAAERSAIVVEDLDRGIGEERALFHLLNRARESALSVLLTSRSAPGDLAVDVPDLRSRLRALPVVELHAPDEALLKAVLVKLFCDRQLNVEPAVIDYLACAWSARCRRRPPCRRDRPAGARHAPQGDPAPGGRGPGGPGRGARVTKT